MKPVVGLYIKYLIYGPKHHLIEGKQFGLSGLWEELGFVLIYGSIILTPWIK